MGPWCGTRTFREAMTSYHWQLHLFQTMARPMMQTDCHEPTRRDYFASASVVVPSRSHQPQPQGRPARQATRAEAHGKQQVVLSKCDKFQQAVQPPSCQDCFCNDGSMITVEHQPPEASISKVVNQALSIEA